MRTRAIVATLLCSHVLIARAQLNNLLDSKSLGYKFDERVVAAASKSPLTCDTAASPPGFAGNDIVQFCGNAKGSSPRIGFAWKKKQMSGRAFNSFMGGLVLLEINSQNEGRITCEDDPRFNIVPRANATVTDCRVQDAGKTFYVSYLLFRLDGNDVRQVLYVLSPTPDSADAQEEVRTAIRKIASTLEVP